MPAQLLQPIVIASLYGSSAISGDAISVVVKLFGDGKAELIIPADMAAELIGLIGTSIAEAHRMRALG